MERGLKNAAYPEPVKGATERLCAFLPPDVRRAIFGLLLESYGGEKRLAQDIGCSLSSLHEWAEEGGRTPGDKYMSIILSLALANCPEARDLLRKELLEAVEHLCADLDISGKARKSDLSLLMDALDEKSREILWHLWWHRHAQLDELVELIGASTDMEVLLRLREVINPAAERILGEPILEFNESRVDPVTGEKVLFSWWLAFDKLGLGTTEGLTTELEGEPLAGRRDRPLVDLFDERDHIMIIAELPPPLRFYPEEALVRLRRERSAKPLKPPALRGLRVRAPRGEASARRLEGLAKEAEVAYKNGILKIKLAKR